MLAPLNKKNNKKECEACEIKDKRHRHDKPFLKHQFNINDMNEFCLNMLNNVPKETSDEYFQKLLIELGMTPEEREKEMIQMHVAIDHVENDFLQKAIEEKQEMMNQIKSLNTRNQNFLKCLKYDDPNVKKAGAHGSLRQKVKEINMSFQKYQQAFEQVLKISNCFKKENDPFVVFQNENMMLSLHEREQLDKSLKAVENKLKSMKKNFDGLCDKIHNICKELGEDPIKEIQIIIDDENINHETINILNDYHKSLSTKYQKNKAEILNLLYQIDDLYNELDFPISEKKIFISSISDFSNNNINKCKRELDELQKIKNEIRLQQGADAFNQMSNNRDKNMQNPQINYYENLILTNLSLRDAFQNLPRSKQYISATEKLTKSLIKYAQLSGKDYMLKNVKIMNMLPPQNLLY